MKIRKIFAILFCAVLFIPGIGMLLGKGDRPDKFLEKENRPKTEFAYTSPDKLPENTENWFNDNYGFRGSLIKRYNRIMRSLFSVNDQNKCIIGEKGYLFLGNSYDLVISGFTNDLFFTQNEKDYIAKIYEDNKALAENSNAAYYAFIAPNKHSVYPEKMPYYIHIKSGFDIYGFVRSVMDENKIRSVDMKALLRDKYAAEHNVLYHKTDTHWSSLGAYYAYYEVMQLIRQDFPDIKIMQKPEFTKVSNTTGYDLVNICGFNGQKQDDFAMAYDLKMPKLTDIRTAKPFAGVTTATDEAANPDALNNRTILVLRDSFGIALFPFMANTFSKVIYIHQSKLFDPQEGYRAMIEKYHPDIVIDERVERGLNTLPKAY